MAAIASNATIADCLADRMFATTCPKVMATITHGLRYQRHGVLLFGLMVMPLLFFMVNHFALQIAI